MKIKLDPTGRPIPQVGHRVTIPWWEAPMGSCDAKRVPNLIGKIKYINGGYVYVKIKGNPRYDVLELYHNEFYVIDFSLKKMLKKMR